MRADRESPADGDSTECPNVRMSECPRRPFRPSASRAPGRGRRHARTRDRSFEMRARTSFESSSPASSPASFARGSRASRKTFRKRVFSPTRREIVFAAGDAPWSRGPGRGRHRGHRRRSAVTCVEGVSSAERPKRVARPVVDATLRRRRGSISRSRLAKKRRSALRERPNRRARDHAPGPRACRGDPR